MWWCSLQTVSHFSFLYSFSSDYSLLSESYYSHSQFASYSLNMIYLLIAIGLSPGGSSTVHIYTQTIHITIQNKQYIEQHNNFGRVRAVPHLG